MRRTRRFTSLALVAGLTLAITGCGDDGGDDTPLGRIRERDRLIVGTKYDQPLFGQVNPATGKPEGFDVEIAKEIAKAILGDAEKIEFKEAVSKNREPFLRDDVVDIVVATYTINDKRKAEVDFAGPYYVAGQDIMVKANNTSITDVKSLNGKKVCSVTGSTSEKNVKEQAPQAKLTLFDTYSKCSAALDDGRVEAVTTDNVILLGQIQANPGKFKLVGKPFTTENYGIGVKKGANDLRTLINDLLEQMYSDGRWKAAYDRTAGTVVPGAPTPPPVDRY